MATVAVQPITRTGLEAAYSAASGGGDKFRPGKHTFLHIVNGGGSDITATIATPATVQGMAVADVAVTVTAGEERFVGPFPPELFAATADGLASVAWSGTTSVTFAAVDAA